MIIGSFIGEHRAIEWVLQFLPVLLTSFAAGFAATALCKKIAIKLGVVDRPDALVKTHLEPVAYLGGVGILAGVITGVMTGAYLLHKMPHFGDTFRALLGISAGAIIACAVGVIDDIVDIRPWQKILGQVAAAMCLVFAGISPNLQAFAEPFGMTIAEPLDRILGIGVVLVFVLGATNSLNLLDGLDGLCGGVTVIIAIAMLFLAVHLATWGFSEHGDPVRLTVGLALVGAVIGFLPFNRHPAKIFMGDAGSMLLGFVIAALMILFAEGHPRWWLASIVVFGLPILDTATAMVRRLLNRRPLFLSDRGHIYDQMIDRGIPLRRTVAISYALAAMYAIIGVAMSQIRTRYAALVHLAVMIISALVIWKKGYLKMEGLRGALRKPSATEPADKK